MEDEVIGRSTTRDSGSRRISRRGFLKAAGAMGGILLVAGCAGQSAAPAAAPTAAPVKPAAPAAPASAPGVAPQAAAGAAGGDTIRFGTVLELTGGTASLGQGNYRGVQMAVDKINATSKKVLGKKLEWVSEDDRSDTQATINAVNSLLLREKVQFIIGPGGSTFANTAASAVAQYKPIWILPGASTSALETLVGKEPWMFHPYPWDRDYYGATIKAFKPIRDQIPRVAIIYVNDVYGNEHIKAAREAYEKGGFEIVMAEAFQPKATDLGSLMARVKQANADVFHAIAQPQDGVTVAKGVRESGLKAKLYHLNNVPSIPDWFSSVGQEAAEGWLAVVPYAAGVQWPASKEYPELYPSAPDWEKEYQAKFNRIPASQDAIGYSSVVMLALAISNAGTTEQGAVIKALEKLKTMTIMGPLEFTVSEMGAIHSAYRDMQVAQIQNGKLMIVHPEDAANAKLKLSSK